MDSAIHVSDTGAGPSTSTSLHHHHHPASDFQWGRVQVHALISSVEEFFEDFYDGTKKKKAIWNAVAEHMREKGYHCSGSDCDKKWRNLKTTYIRVLQKQVRGDTSTRFEYFDALHHILGQEIDPLGMREQALNQGVSASGVQDSIETTELHELTTNDDDEVFLWTSEVVHFLLDYITECKDAFAMPDVDLNAVWDDIGVQLSQLGEDVSGDECQVKWHSLEEELRAHQALLEASGVVPRWPFYAHTREVVEGVEVRTTVPRAKQPNTNTHNEPNLTSASPTRPSHKDTRGRSVLARVKHIESTLSVKQRLERLESRVESSKQQKEATRKTNVILVQVLAELRRINTALKQEEEEAIRGIHSVSTQPQDGAPCSPNQEFIIVEAYTDQL